ncbi:hypothetical protein QBC46DRAFT_452845 [Diplogelasinospora grovesii]|uniref:Uncharacterized protein n=1 Tax=Diplogelasinospora grovesii TaxID=303347 RepID=A0AAN6S1A5_9PEZI|nr:hypothetical protein QBC46DRAFT_452845 [Diplogelasinospora grovesii]
MSESSSRATALPRPSVLPGAPRLYIRGPMGRDGRDGRTGPRGHPGRNGRRGPRGHTGAAGPAGENGTNGDKGDPGERGAPGERGLPGLPAAAPEASSSTPAGLAALWVCCASTRVLMELTSAISAVAAMSACAGILGGMTFKGDSGADFAVVFSAGSATSILTNPINSRTPWLARWLALLGFLSFVIGVLAIPYARLPEMMREHPSFIPTFVVLCVTTGGIVGSLVWMSSQIPPSSPSPS